MSVAVTDSSGIKIPLKDPQTSITNFAAAIQSLLSNSPQIQAMSIGALTRAQELTWDKKAQAIAEIYDALPSPV
jgi:glycosyltransferase involved in cell wall biosynthesis